MRRYEIHSVCQGPPLCGQIDVEPWASAVPIAIDNYPWYTGGQKQPTEARAVYDERAIYVQFRCQDRHIFAQATELNGPVYEDSCVEFFASPDPSRSGEYFNLEINCCGTFLMGFGPARHPERRRITPELASQIEIATLIGGPIKEEADTDEQWWAAAAIRFETLSEFIGRDIYPRLGDIWRGNFYRCGGKTDPQLACWNPIELPKPNFHSPQFFGELHFA